MTQSVSLATTTSLAPARMAARESLSTRSPRGYWPRLARNPTPLIGLLIVSAYLVLALLGEWVAPYSATEQHLADALQSSSLRYPFGTDQFGRDILSRVMVGSRSMMILATASTLLALSLGGGMGVIAAYYGGLVDDILMRATDVLLAFPALLLALLILSMLGSAMVYLIFCIGIVFAPAIARVVRSVVLELKTREFVEAARMIGATDSRIMWREILPNLLNTLLVEAAIYFGSTAKVATNTPENPGHQQVGPPLVDTLVNSDFCGTAYFGYAILVGSGLGFLGLGAQPPSPDWGLQVNDGRNFLLVAPWIALFPALAISSLVIGVNLLADGLTGGTPV